MVEIYTHTPVTYRTPNKKGGRSWDSQTVHFLAVKSSEGFRPSRMVLFCGIMEGSISNS